MLSHIGHLRQIHLDFHTAEQVGSVGHAFDGEKFAARLKQAHVNSIILFARCHHGFLYYHGDETILGPVHPGLKRDLLAEQIAACQAAGINVEIYTTVQWDVLTAHRHPEWRVMHADGSFEGTPPFEAGFYRKLSLSTPYADVFKDHVRDILKRFSPDGIYFDFIRPDVCVNPYTVAMMEQRGLDPANPRDREEFGFWNANRYEIELSELVRSHNPNLTVTFNGGHVGMRHRKAAKAYTHFELETLPSGGWGYMYFPVTGRFARTLGPGVVGTTGKFHSTWGDFHTLKNLAALEYEVFRMVAQGAGCSIGDQLHPSGELDRETYELVGKVYGQLEACEPWLDGCKPAVDIGVLHPEEFLGGGVMDLPRAIQGITRMLMEAGHQFDVIDTTQSLDKYKLLILPDFIRVDERFAKKLADFQAKGGAIIMSYQSGLKPGSDMFARPEWGLSVQSEGPLDDSGLLARGRRYERHDFAQYVRAGSALQRNYGPCEHPIYLHGMDVGSGEGVERLADFIEPFFDRSYKHYMSHLQAPSSGRVGGGAVFRKGSLIYFASPIACQYEECAPLWVKHLLLNAIDLLLPQPLLRHSGPSTIETGFMLQPEKNRAVVHLLHYIPERRGSEFDVVEDVIPVYDVDLSIRADKPVKSVTTAPQGAPLAFSETAGRVDIRVPEVNGHQMIVVEFA